MAMELTERTKVEGPDSYWGRRQSEDGLNFIPVGSGIPDLVNMYHEQFLGSTKFDVEDMERMGKVQELKRSYKPISALSFVVLVQATWEYILIDPQSGLINGGLAGYFWMYVWSLVGGYLIVLSIAESASMAPTSGGQYHWVSEFAPPKWQRFLSHQTAWMSTLAWQAGNASGSLITATLIQALIQVVNPEYSYPRWHTILLQWAAALLIFTLNIGASRQVPIMQNCSLILHVALFWIFIILMWTLSPRNTADVVFLQFSNTGGWKTTGLAMMVGQVSTIYTLTAADAAAHISEEVKDAGLYVAKAMVDAYVLNGVLGFVAIITFLFCVTDIEAALADESGYPIVWVLRQITSLPVLLFLVSLLLVLVFAGTLSYNIATTRLTWAFARDKGFLGYTWARKVSTFNNVPINTNYMTLTFTVLMSLIHLGSDAAFEAIVSLNIVALMTCYFASTACVLYRKIYHPAGIAQHRYSLGRFGIAVNVGACLYAAFAWFWCFWPTTKHVDAEEINWAFLIYVVAIVIGLLDWAFRGRKEWVGPAKLVKE